MRQLRMSLGPLTPEAAKAQWERFDQIRPQLLAMLEQEIQAEHAREDADFARAFAQAHHHAYQAWSYQPPPLYLQAVQEDSDRRWLALWGTSPPRARMAPPGATRTPARISVCYLDYRSVS